MKKCKYCNAEMEDNEITCKYCGSVQPCNPTTPPPFTNGNHAFNEDEYYSRNNAFDSNANGKSRGVAAILAILLGQLGIQYFYLGKNTAGVISIFLSIVSCGLWALVMFIQGIMMFCMSNREFENKFIKSDKSFPVF